MKHLSRKKKIILGIVAAFTLLIGVGCVYAIKAVKDASATVAGIYEKAERKNGQQANSDKPVNFAATEPFSVLLLGVDSGGLGRSDQGRSDTMMVATVNPKEKKTTIVSLDRDIYTKIIGHNTYDKLNHAYAFGGVGMAMDSVEALLDIPIHHYMTINLQGFADLVDAVGGITVNNKYHFELDGVELQPGVQELNGKEALSFARYRKYDPVTKMGDPEGDIGRQARQREVVSEIANKILSFDSISRYQKILKAVEKNTKTDLVWEDFLNIIQGYTAAASEIVPLQLEGEGVMMNNIYYQKLYPDKLLAVQNQLKTQLNLPTSTSLNRTNYADNQFFGEEGAQTKEVLEEKETKEDISVGNTWEEEEKETSQWLAPEEETNYDNHNTTGNWSGGTTSNPSSGTGNSSSTNKPQTSTPPQESTPPSSSTPEEVPSQPSKPVEPTEPEEPVKPTEPSKPVEPSQPEETTPSEVPEEVPSSPELAQS